MNYIFSILIIICFVWYGEIMYRKGLKKSKPTLSCAPSAPNGMHTFSTEEQWSCDCGQIRNSPTLAKEESNETTK